MEVGPGLGQMVNISGKEAVVFPDFKIIIYNVIFKTVYDGQNFSYKPDLERKFPKLRKKTRFPSLSSRDLIV